MSSPFAEGARARLPQGEVNYTLREPSKTAPLVVCIHGLSGAISSFARVEPLLVAAGFRVLLYDLYGFGLSAAPKGHLDLSAFVGQLEGLLGALLPAAERVHLLGYSMGGVVAVEFARRHPDRVARLLLLAPGGLLAREGTPHSFLLFKGLRGPCGCCVLALATCVASICRCCMRRAVSKGGWFEPDVREPMAFKEVSQQNTARFLWNPKRHVNSYLRALRRMPLWQEDARQLYAGLARSPVPVLFVWGSEDGVVPFCEAEEDLEALFGEWGTSCIRLEGAGHGLLLEDPQAVVGCAQAWFADSKDPAWLKCLESWRLGDVKAPVATAAPPAGLAIPIGRRGV